MGLLTVLLLVILGCMGCCCGGLPLFGLWPRLDPAPVEAALRGAPLVVDHACAPDVACDAVQDVRARLYPLHYGLFSGQVVALVEVEATCDQPRVEGGRVGPAVACAGVLSAVYLATEAGWELDYVTESAAGLPPSGQPYEGSSGDWDD